MNIKKFKTKIAYKVKALLKEKNEDEEKKVPDISAKKRFLVRSTKNQVEKGEEVKRDFLIE